MKLSRLFSRLAVLTLVTAFVFALTGCGSSGASGTMTLCNDTNHILTELHITPSGQANPDANILPSSGAPAHAYSQLSTQKPLPSESYDILIVDDTGATYHFDRLPAAYLETGSTVSMLTSQEGILNLSVLMEGQTVAITVVPTSCTLPQTSAPAVADVPAVA